MSSCWSLAVKCAHVPLLHFCTSNSVIGLVVCWRKAWRSLNPNYSHSAPPGRTSTACCLSQIKSVWLDHIERHGFSFPFKRQLSDKIPRSIQQNKVGTKDRRRHSQKWGEIQTLSRGGAGGAGGNPGGKQLQQTEARSKAKEPKHVD